MRGSALFLALSVSAHGVTAQEVELSRSFGAGAAAPMILRSTTDLAVMAPVIEAASSPHRNFANAATCSTLTNCLVGCASNITSLITCCSVMPRALAVAGICFSTKGVRT